MVFKSRTLIRVEGARRHIVREDSRLSLRESSEPWGQQCLITLAMRRVMKMNNRETNEICEKVQKLDSLILRLFSVFRGCPRCRQRSVTTVGKNLKVRYFRGAKGDYLAARNL